MPLRFVAGHHRRTYRRPGQYRVVGRKGEHVLIAEAALGKPLPPAAVVHHFNGDRSDNRNSNLVVCQDDAYHNLLHKRQRAFAVCGHADWKKCRYCKKWDDPVNLRSTARGSHGYHLECMRVCHPQLQKGAA